MSGELRPDLWVCCVLGCLHGAVCIAAILVTFYVFWVSPRRCSYQKYSLVFIILQTATRTLDLFILPFESPQYPPWADRLHGFFPALVLIISYSMLIRYFFRLYYFLASTRPPPVSTTVHYSINPAENSDTTSETAGLLTGSAQDDSATPADTPAETMYIGIPPPLGPAGGEPTPQQPVPPKQPAGPSRCLNCMKCLVPGTLLALNGCAVVAWIPVLALAATGPEEAFKFSEKCFVVLLGSCCIILSFMHLAVGLLFYRAHRALTEGLMYSRDKHQKLGTKSLFLSLVCSVAFLFKGICDILSPWVYAEFNSVYLILLILLSETIPLSLILWVFSYTPKTSPAKLLRRNAPTI
ncbi:hypothetical protein PAPYR_3609 [Paratrimastix pyriformis]|uniref:Uncharacterized protein n=1 Tax=Paratrimastix pyriformis TaxID=342808 RepID=A0ABQ8URR4_9EUKA|nr:hypothetical protein PAPYR_3609 [Paratrimastix pyriformis]